MQHKCQYILRINIYRERTGNDQSMIFLNDKTTLE